MRSCRALVLAMAIVAAPIGARADEPVRRDAAPDAATDTASGAAPDAATDPATDTASGTATGATTGAGSDPAMGAGTDAAIHGAHAMGVASDAGADADARSISPARRALAIALAIGPGVALHGLGSYVAREGRTAKRIALASVGGLALTIGAGGLVGSTGAHVYTLPAVPLVLAGVGTLMTTWVSDIWSAAGGARVHAEPYEPPAWSLEVGQTWQRDPYRNRLLARAASRVELGRASVGGLAIASVTGDAWLGFADVRYRVLGDAAGSRAFVRTGGRVQRDRDDMVTQLVGELEVGGRLDLRWVGDPLRTAFVEFSTGAGILRATYNGDARDLDSLLLGRFAWGTYLPDGELVLYYDHRRDGLAGGINASRAAGFMGSFGANLDIGVRGPWALRGELQIGNAWLTTLAFAYRGGAR